MDYLRKNIVVGTRIIIVEPVFKGSYKNTKYIKDRQWSGVVISDSYGIDKKHWFMIICESSEDQSIVIGTKYRRQGKNLYNNSSIISQPNGIEQLTKNKNLRKRLVEIYA